nr:hypothetical protein [Methylobacterium nodulans]
MRLPWAGPEGFDARAYEVAVLVHLRDRLRAGDVWVEGSRAHRTFDDYLLPRPTFAVMRTEGRLGLAGAGQLRGVAGRARCEPRTETERSERRCCQE